MSCVESKSFGISFKFSNFPKLATPPCRYAEHGVRSNPHTLVRQAVGPIVRDNALVRYVLTRLTKLAHEGASVGDHGPFMWRLQDLRWTCLPCEIWHSICHKLGQCFWEYLY